MRKVKKKRKLRLPFRIIKNLIIIVFIMSLCLFLAFKLFLEDDLNKLRDTYNNTIVNTDMINNKNIYKSSYTILVLGVDENLYSRTDSINLVTVNANTNKMNIINVPRDTYIPLSCVENLGDKINHANVFGGVKCTIDAVEKLFNTKVDFYVMLSFDGFLNIINELGTITTNVPDLLNGEPWCEQTANRIDQICFDKFGEQEVNSEQALAIARSRQYTSDLDRGMLQTQIMKDTIKSLFTVRDFEKLNNILITVDDNFETNISFEQFMLMAYNYYQFEKSENQIERLQIIGIDEETFGDNSGWGWYFFPDEASINILNTKIKNFLTEKPKKD